MRLFWAEFQIDWFFFLLDLDISVDISSNLALSRALILLAQNLIKVEITF